MIINSPIGRFPFTVTRVSIRKQRLKIDGQMGTWPTSIEIRPSDLPDVLSKVATSPAVVSLLAASAGALLTFAVRKPVRVINAPLSQARPLGRTPRCGRARRRMRRHR